jgi:predicted permease
MSSLIQDLNVAFRQLRRRPLFTFTAVLTLAIGIGVNTIAFTVVNGLLFKGSAFRAKEDVGRIVTIPGGDEIGYASLAEHQRFTEALEGALDVAAEGRLSIGWRHDGMTETAWALFVTSNYFSIVDATPIAGRVLVARSGDGLPSAVIGERFWRRNLNSAPLSGLTLRLNGIDVHVTGVLPEAFAGPAGLYSPDVWLPLEDLAAFRTSPLLQNREQRWLFVFGRVQPGATVAEVQGRIGAVAATMAQEWPETHKGRSARFRLFKEGNSELRQLGRAAAMAMGIIGLVLLLACFNVTNLLLARAVEREREMGIRAAIGASPSRLVRLVVTEGFLIAIMAGAAAVLLSRWTQTLVGSFAIPIEQPQHVDLTPDATVIGYIALLVLIAGVLPGLWPALSAARVDVLRVLGSQGGSSSGGRTSTMRRWLVGAQIAGSTIFLAIAALFVQSYGKVAVADLGFDRTNLVIAEFSPASHGYDVERSERHAHALLARVQALPGVTDAALADRVPFFVGFERMTAASVPGAACAPGACTQYATLAVGPGYFKTMGIALTAGREFNIDEPQPEVIVNQPLAQQLWPDGRGLGEPLRIGDRGDLAIVIGITARSLTRGLTRELPTLYVPLARNQFSGAVAVAARTATSPESLIRPITESAEAVDQSVSMLSVKTMEQRLAVQMWPFRTISWLFSICGFFALLLATVGLAGVVIHAVNRRLREFSVRVSIGATPAHLVSEVLRSSARLLLPGLIAGTIFAAIGARLVQSMFVGVNVLNPLTYLAVALLECAIVIAACLSPALRAAHVDPLVALRAE